jgi:hypothetical protein
MQFKTFFFLPVFNFEIFANVSGLEYYSTVSGAYRDHFWA